MSRDQADYYMESQHLTYIHVCEAAASSFRHVTDSDQGWPPTRNTRAGSKKGTPPPAYGFQASYTDDHIHAYLLQQNSSRGKPKPGDKCIYCGELGHWMRNSPKNPQSSVRQKGTNKNKPATNKSTTPSSSSDSTKTHWKYTPPKAGASDTMKRGHTTFKWNPTAGESGRWDVHSSNPKHRSNRRNRSRSASPSTRRVTIDPNPPQAHYLSDHESTPDSNSDDDSSWGGGAFLCTLCDSSGPSLLSDFWILFYNMLRLIVFALSRSTIPSLFSSMALGFSLGSLPSGFWTFVWTFLTSHWTTVLPIVCWFILLFLSLFGRFLLGLPPTPPVPEIPPGHKLKRLTPNRLKQLHRQAKRDALPKKLTRHTKTPFPKSFGLRRRTDRRLPLSVYKRFLLSPEELATLRQFAAAIQFCREGDGWTMNDMNPNDLTSSLDPEAGDFCFPMPLVDDLSTSGTTKSSTLTAVTQTAHAFLSVMIYPFSFLSRHSDSDDGNVYPVVWDSGASLSLSSC